jgi:hypothetical protein
MRIEFHCPRCLEAESSDIIAGASEISCRHCHWNRPLPEGEIQAAAPVRCLVCGCEDLWRQKDFPAHWGVAIVAAGILLSTLATAWMRPLLAIGILMAFALVDMLLFLLMRDALVCYRCHARFRRVRVTDEHPKFQLEMNERYRQESLRAQQSDSVPN